MRISDWSSDVCSSDLNFKRDVERLCLYHGFLNFAFICALCDQKGEANPEKIVQRSPIGKPCVRSKAPRASIRHVIDRLYGRRVAVLLGDPPRIITEPEHNTERVKFAPLCRRSEEHTSELQSLMRISYAVFCLQTNTQHYT